VGVKKTRELLARKLGHKKVELYATFFVTEKPSYSQVTVTVQQVTSGKNKKGSASFTLYGVGLDEAYALINEALR
jgi:hypothetical protein